ncbi:MAG TPA: hypothetical protein VI932_07755 [Bacteroidota bacterium]|nr:hypothetical protein [Bacteroidota bacterium]
MPVLILLLFILLPGGNLAAQARPGFPEHDTSRIIRIFLDCSRCDIDYFRTSIRFVHYVRDREKADVHIIVTTLSNGGGGTEYTLEFRGLGRFGGIDDTLSFSTRATDTEDMERSRMDSWLRLGLVRYVSSSPEAERLKIDYTPPDSTPTVVTDPWDNWVFRTSARASIQGEQSRSYQSYNGSFSASRVTEDLKLNFSVNGRYSETEYDYVGYQYTDISRSRSFSSLAVWSAGAHWSAGGTFSTSASTYSNTRLSVSLAPAVEFNVFPYNEATRKYLKLLYRISLTAARYEEETIYFRTSESVWRQELSVSLEMKQPWGEAGGSLSGSHLLRDIRKYEIGLFGNVSVRIVEGLSFDVQASVFRTRDQISLRKGTATTEEVLLQRRELESQYNFYVSWGISYSFGSIFNNVVNTRMGGGGSSMVYYY